MNTNNPTTKRDAAQAGSNPLDQFQVERSIQIARNLLSGQCGVYGLAEFKVLKTEITFEQQGQIFLRLQHRCKLNTPEQTDFVFTKNGNLISAEPKS